MIIKGKLITCKRQVKEFKGKEVKEKLYITLADVELSDKKMKELQEAFQEVGKKFTPSWLTKFEGYVNLATEFFFVILVDRFIHNSSLKGWDGNIII